MSSVKSECLYRRRETIGSATLYLADAWQMLAHVEADAVLSDPPYGMAWDVDSSRFSGGESTRGRRQVWNAGVTGDDRPFDPGPLLRWPEVILWGSNHYELPAGGGLVWIKRNDAAFGTFLSDAEMAWIKGRKGVRCFKDVSFNGSGANFERHHPTEKPASLMEWCLQFVKGQTILDPFMGSGTTGVACARAGRAFVGIEIEERFFDVACERVAAAHAQGRLFA